MNRAMSLEVAKPIFFGASVAVSWILAVTPAELSPWIHGGAMGILGMLAFYAISRIVPQIIRDKKEEMTELVKSLQAVKNSIDASNEAHHAEMARNRDKWFEMLERRDGKANELHMAHLAEMAAFRDTLNKLSEVNTELAKNISNCRFTAERK